MSANRHCTVVEIAGTGILIEGTSGAGKTSLAFGLLEAGGRARLSAHFVCDDQAFVAAENGNLVAICPDTIAGKAELRGLGIVEVAATRQARIGLVARLAPDETIERMPVSQTVLIEGISVPLLTLPERHGNHSVRVVMAWLDRMRTGDRDARPETDCSG